MNAIEEKYDEIGDTGGRSKMIATILFTVMQMSFIAIQFFFLGKANERITIWKNMRDELFDEAKKFYEEKDRIQRDALYKLLKGYAEDKK